MRLLRNEQSLARLNKALADPFPGAVLHHALTRRWTPPTPRLAIDSYWRSHPLRADRLARALAAAAELSRPAGAVSRSGVRPWPRLLLRLRPAGLPAGLA